MAGMFAAAAIVASTRGKNTDKKMRNVADASPTPNQRIANGIQASGDRLRKKLTTGRKAARAHAFCPIQRPIGIPVRAARRNPKVTRKSDVTRSVKRRPFRISSAKPRTTSSGAGKALAWNTPLAQTALHIAIRAATTSSGRPTAETNLVAFNSDVLLGEATELRTPRLVQPARRASRTRRSRF